MKDPKNASIVHRGSAVKINCVPEDHCIVIYRAYGNRTLNIGQDFPTNIDLNPDNYSFALFRTDHNHIDERPFMTKFVPVEGEETSPPILGI